MQQEPIASPRPPTCRTRRRVALHQRRPELHGFRVAFSTTKVLDVLNRVCCCRLDNVLGDGSLARLGDLKP
jgi:hypothetical protein